MSAEKKVFSRLFKEEKTELATQKIELALVDELKSSIKMGLKIESTLKGQLTSYNGLLRAGDSFSTKYKELIKSANDLGVPIPSELKKLQSLAEGFTKKGKALQKVSNLF